MKVYLDFVEVLQLKVYLKFAEVLQQEVDLFVVGLDVELLQVDEIVVVAAELQMVF